MYRTFSFLLLIILSLPAATEGKAQPFRVMFYNTENFFDTKDDPKTNDDEFTPAGSRHWSPYRYRNKLQQIAKVIVATGEWQAPAIVGLCEIENDSVLHNLLTYTPLREEGYEYRLTTGSDMRGINIALLYQPAQFACIGNRSCPIPFSHTQKRSRDLLHVWGKVTPSDTLDIFVCHFPSQSGGQKATETDRMDAARYLRHLCDSLFQIRTNPAILVMGDFNDRPHQKSIQRIESAENNPLLNLFSDEKASELPGSTKYRYNWQQFDQLFLSETFFRPASPIRYIENSAQTMQFPFLTTPDEKYGNLRPFRTYHNYQYEGGFSDHFPLRADFLIASPSP